MRIYKKRNKYYKNNLNINNKHIVFGILFSVLMLPVSVMIVSSIQASHIGTELRIVEDEIIKIEEENRKLQTKLIKESSLWDISNNLDNLGLQKPNDVIYIQKEKTKVARASY